MAEQKDSVFDAEFFKPHTPASFQHLIGINNGSPEIQRAAMANVKQTPTVVGKIKEEIRTFLWKLWYEKIAPLPPQRQLPALPLPATPQRRIPSSQPVRTAQHNGATKTAITLLPPPQRQPASVLGTDLTTGEEVIVSQVERRQGLYCVGANGTGKSVLLANLIRRDLELGYGLCALEPHGDLTKTVLSLVPEHRLKDVILLDVMDSAFPFGLNLFQSDLPGDTNEAEKTANFLMHLFEKIWNVGTETPRLQQVLRNISRTLLANPGMTFAEIPLLLWDDTVREKLVSNVANTQTQLFWQNYNGKSQRDKDELTASTINKVDGYLSSTLVANLVSQSNTSINFRRIMDSSKILLIQL